MSQLLALLSSGFYGFADLTGGLATRRMPVWAVLAWSQVLGLVVLGSGMVIVGSDDVTPADLGFGALAGIVGLFGIAIIYSALASGSMSVVAPIAGAVGAIIPVTADVVSGADLSSGEVLGIAAAIGAVLLIGLEGRSRRIGAARLWQALLAGVMFGILFIAFSQTSEQAGLWPLVAARSVSIPIVAIVALLTGVAVRPRGSDLRLVLVAGNLDMAANVFLALALQRGPLAVNAVLGSLYPMFTVLAAVVLLKERPTRMQWLGIGLAVAAAALLAL